jgi:hypothetical protein
MNMQFLISILGINVINLLVIYCNQEVVMKQNLLIWLIDVIMLVFGKHAKFNSSTSYLNSLSSIYVDAVINHMAAGGNRASAG